MSNVVADRLMGESQGDGERQQPERRVAQDGGGRPMTASARARRRITDGAWLPEGCSHPLLSTGPSLRGLTSETVTGDNA
jgi:hypothetical protein